MNKIETF